LSSKISTPRAADYVYKNSYLFLIIPLFFIAYSLLATPGIPIGNGDFPYLELSLYPDKKLWTWNEYGSYHGMEVLPRYPIIGFFHWIDLPPDISSKFLITGVFAIASFSFYFSAVRLFKTKLDVNDLKFRIMTVAGGFFYAYNVWSFHRIGHWYFWLGYALLPLFFVSVVYAFRYPRKWKYVVASALLWSVASSTPHMTVFFGIIFVGLCGKFLLCFLRKKNSKKTLLLGARPIALIMIVYISINLYWIYPYLVSSQSENFQWSAAVTEETTRELSRESDFLNVVRLLEGTFNMGQIRVSPSTSSDLYSIWLLASFVVPVAGFSALVWWKRNLFRYAILFSAISVIGILLTMGTNAPFSLYSILLFHTPIFSSLQILFREPDKWGFLVAFGFSFLIVISGYNILTGLGHVRHKKILSAFFVSLLLSSIAIYFYPAYSDSTENLYRPVVIPDDFKDLDNRWTVVGSEKTFMTPFAPYNTTWGKDKGTSDLYAMAAPVPNIAPSDYNNVEKYHKYFVNSIVRNKTYGIQQMIYPLGTSYIIYHNDSLMPLNKQLIEKIISLSVEVKPNKNKNTGLFKIFDVGKNEGDIEQAGILHNNILVVGGLGRLASLSLIPYFNTANSSVIFLDQYIKNEISVPAIKNANAVVLQSNKDDFVLSFLDDKYILKPYEETNRHEPNKVWSKAGSNDPGNAWFTPYVEDLGMQNWDFDYGKGLVITNAMGARLSMPVHLSETDQYDIFIRHLKNPKGGIINVYLDNKLIKQVNTWDERSNRFMWQEITKDKFPMHLKKGEHTLTLENVAGFNAVNMFDIMPSSVSSRLEDNANSIANRMKNILFLEAESSFLYDKSNSSAYAPSQADYYYFYKYQNNGSEIAPTNQLFDDTVAGTFKIPPNKELMYLQLRASGNTDHNNNISNNSNVLAEDKNNSDTSSNQSYFLVKNFEIFSTHNQTSVYGFDFENKQENLPLGVTRQISPSHSNALWLLSSGQNTTSYQNESLKIVVKQSNTNEWNIVSTDFIPVDDFTKSVQYNISISAKDVKQLHSRVVYYDRNKNEISADFISTGHDGTFTDTTANTFPIPQGTKYLKLQTLAAANSTNESSYTIGKLAITPLAVEMWKNYDDTSMVSVDKTTPISGKGSLRVDLKQNNNDNRAPWSVVSTDFIPVNDKSHYNISMSVSAKDARQLHSKVVYYDENKEHIQNLNNLEETNEFVFPGTDGTFSRSYKVNPSIPLGTKYLQLQMLASPTEKTTSSYLVDNIKIEEIVPEMALFDDDIASFDVLNGSIPQKGIRVVDTANSIKERRTESVPVAAENENSDNVEVSNNNSSLMVLLADSEREGWINQGQNIDKQAKDKRNNNYNYSVIQTKPILVRPEFTYNYTTSIEGQNLDYLAAIVHFVNGSNIVENSTRYGPNASSGSVLSLTPSSEVYTTIDILKPANYTLALRAGTCESCSFIRLTIEDKENDKIVMTDTISLKQYSSNKKALPDKDYYERITNSAQNNNNNNNTNTISNNMQLKWIQLNNTTWLDRGKYEVKIYSDSQTDLDSMIIYSEAEENNNNTINNNNYYSKAFQSAATTYNDNGQSGKRLKDKFYDKSQEHLFGPTSPSPFTPTDAAAGQAAYIAEYNKINPTKHELKIKNVTEPFMMSFAESYDPLWVAYASDDGSNKSNNSDTISANSNDTNEFKIKSIPLYSIINGFYINKTGDYTLTIEYEPQKWFIESSIVSVLAIFLSLSFLVVRKKALFTQR
jgi:hypothetical protein